MYTLDTEFGKRAGKTAFLYLLASIGCALFGALYELFSHGVYSFYMLYAFAFPLTGGVLPFLAISLFAKKDRSVKLPGISYHCGIATLTVGSILCGVMEIYGTTNMLTCWYWIVGSFLCFAEVLDSVIRSKKD